MGGSAILGGQYHCTGFYVQGNQRTAMTIGVSIDGLAITGEGRDAIGSFSIRGAIARDGIAVAFTKNYTTHSIEYNGELTDGATIVGVWRFPGYLRGGDAFVLVLEPVNMAPIVEKALWKGHYVQYGREHATAQELAIYATGRIQGVGRDSVGDFTISGRFLEVDTTMWPFIYNKTYSGHTISYEGVRQGAVMTGGYQSPYAGRGDFVLQDHTSRL